MAGNGRQFRVFVSSTFSDMHAEREVLQRRVFPRLQRFCQRRGAHFLAVDLRWRVSEEAGLYDTTSRPFVHPATGKIAVKVINHSGDRVLKVYEVGD